MISRREALVQDRQRRGCGGIYAARVAARRDAPQKADPPSVISNPPRDFSQPVTYPDPDIITHRSVVQRAARRQHADSAAVDRRHVVRGTGVERPGAVSDLERHPEQPADALDRRRWPRHRVPPAVGQQQRQHVRSSGAPALVRAFGPPRRALRARRIDHGDRRFVPGQAAELAERHRVPSGRQLLVYRSAVRRAVLRRDARCGRAVRAISRGV